MQIGSRNGTGFKKAPDATTVDKNQLMLAIFGLSRNVYPFLKEQPQIEEDLKILLESQPKTLRGYENDSDMERERRMRPLVFAPSEELAEL
jgi:hypothetical protein